MQKQLGMALALAAASSGALAAWTLVEASGEMRTYADWTSLRRNASVVDLWVLFDNIEDPSGITRTKSMSSKSRLECNCQDRRYRYLFTSWHAERMGAGAVTYTLDQVGGWKPVPPDSIISPLWQRACQNP